MELAASNLELNIEIAQRKAVEEALKKSERHYSELLEQSDRLQEQLRRLSRQILSAQEEERKEISRELHDVIAQTLTGINVRLAALEKGGRDQHQGPRPQHRPHATAGGKIGGHRAPSSPANCARRCWMISG